ncbi:hypothetical protein QE369_000490 [Agrobacterium larrymoorei]|uniref:Uncharacterized protein n=1 Tax=Agrobacterium larrymoorei TaxID=160699 RepID=A0AAJ2B8E1_9HYPH|nr:hypothetical protein [Agrobacterium larrymoorei]MDR6100312.1 hypothetical protein [Agrobacterium larrymoorei]
MTKNMDMQEFCLSLNCFSDRARMAVLCTEIKRYEGHSGGCGSHAMKSRSSQDIFKSVYAYFSGGGDHGSMPI